MDFQQCTEKNTSDFKGIVEKMMKKCYFCRAKHNSVNARVRVCNNVKGRRLLK